MVARSIQRVPDQTDPKVNDRIRRHMQIRVEYYSRHPELIDQRLRELDEEWDVERALETGSAALSLAGLALGIMGRRKWFLLPLVVQGFFMQHALQGWCPPLPLLRSMGFRTVAEIDAERYALRAVRGDFDKLPQGEERGRRIAEMTEELKH